MKVGRSDIRNVIFEIVISPHKQVHISQAFHIQQIISRIPNWTLPCTILRIRLSPLSGCLYRDVI